MEPEAAIRIASKMTCDITATFPAEFTSNRKGVSGGTYVSQDGAPAGVAKAIKNAASSNRNRGRATFWADALSRAIAPRTKVAAP